MWWGTWLRMRSIAARSPLARLFHSFFSPSAHEVGHQLAIVAFVVVFAAGVDVRVSGQPEEGCLAQGAVREGVGGAEAENLF